MAGRPAPELTPRQRMHLVRILLTGPATVRIRRTADALGWQWPLVARGAALGINRTLRTLGPLPNVDVLPSSAPVLGEAAPVDVDAVDRLAGLAIPAGQEVVYALLAEPLDWKASNRWWAAPERELDHLWTPARIEARLWASTPELTELGRRALAGELGPLVISGRLLAPLLLPRLDPVEVAPAPAPPLRPLRRPMSSELPIGRAPDGELVAVDVERVTSAAVFGLSGGGKTTLLKTMLLSDLLDRPRQGVVLVDPHADLVAELLTWIPAGRRVVVIGLDDESRPGRWAWNPLAPLRPVREHIVIRGVVAALASALGWTPAMRRLIRTLHLVVRTAVELNATLPPGLALTLLDLGALAEDPELREAVANRLPHLRGAWKRAYDEALGAIVDAVEELRHEPAAAAFFGRSISTWDPRESIDRGDVVLVRPGKAMGYLGAALVTTGIVQAALGRTDIPREQRRPTRLVIDEAQVVTPALGRQLVRVLEEARKYGLYLTLATQSPARLGDLLLHAVTLNASGFLATLGLDALGGRRLAAEWPETTHADLIGLPPRSGLVRAGFGAVRPFQTVLPESLWTRPAAVEAAQDDGPDPDELEAEAAARPRRVLELLELLGGAGDDTDDQDQDQDQDDVPAYPQAPGRAERLTPWQQAQRELPQLPDAPDQLEPAQRRWAVRILAARGWSYRRLAEAFVVAQVTIRRDLGKLDPQAEAGRG